MRIDNDQWNAVLELFFGGTSPSIKKVLFHLNLKLIHHRNGSIKKDTLPSALSTIYSPGTYSINSDSLHSKVSQSLNNVSSLIVSNWFPLYSLLMDKFRHLINSIFYLQYPFLTGVQKKGSFN